MKTCVRYVHDNISLSPYNGNVLTKVVETIKTYYFKIAFNHKKCY